MYKRLRNRPRYATRNFALVATVLAAALGVTPFAAADTWDNSSGNSLWSTNSNWADNTQPTNSDPVIFPDPIPPPGTIDITLSAGEQAQSLTFNAPVQTLTGGLSGATLNISSGNINVGSGAFANIFVPISGSAGLTKTGTGYLALNSTGTVGNSYTGGVTISQGTLRVDNNFDLGNAANGVLISGGELETGISPGMSTSRVITIGALSARIDKVGSGSILTVNTGMADGGFANPLTVTGSGTLVLTASSTRSGNTTINGGHVRLNNGAALGTGGDLISNNGSLEIAGGITHSNIIFLQSNGILRGGGTGAVHNNTVFVQASGSQVFLSGGASATDTLQLGGPGSNQYTGGTGAKTVVNGAGRVTILTAINDYAGDWQIDSGTLRPTEALSLGNGTSPVVVNNTGTLQLFSVTFNRDVALNNGSTLAFEIGAQSFGTHTIASGAGVTFAFKGAGNETLGDAPNDLTGGAGGATITVNSDTVGDKLLLNHPNDYAGNWFIAPSATVRISDANALGTGTSAIVLFGSPNGGTLELAGVNLARSVSMSNASTLRGSGGSATQSGTVTFNNFGTVTFATAAANDVLTIGDAANDYTGGGGAQFNNTIVFGPGTVVLPFANNYNGAWQIDGPATLRVGNAQSLGSDPSAVVVNNGAALELSNVTLDRALTLNSGATLAGAGATPRSDGTATVTSGAAVTIRAGSSASDVFTLGNAANDLTGGGSGSTITVNGAGKVLLTQASNYIGNWNVSGGILQVSNTAGSATGTGTVTVAAGATLQGTGFVGGPVLNNGSVAPGASAGILTIQNSYTQSANGKLDIEIGGLTPGTQYDRLVVTSNLALAGTLEVSLTGSFTPLAIDSFSISSAGGGISGAFANVANGQRLTTIDGLGSFLVHYGAGSAFDPKDIVLSAFQAALPGDYNNNGSVDAGDYVLWRKTDGTPAGYNLWRAHFGQTAGSGAGDSANAAVPEPATLVLLMCAAAGWCLCRRRAAWKDFINSSTRDTGQQTTVFETATRGNSAFANLLRSHRPRNRKGNRSESRFT
jgi:fibronectin-binding autotransporter adhesin